MLSPSRPCATCAARLPENRAKTYPSRDIGDICRIVVHHTVTRADAQPQAIAQAQVKQGKAGITYHYLVGGDGTIYWTQPLESITDQTLTPAVNANGVAVALAGNFMARTGRCPALQRCLPHRLVISAPCICP